MAERVALITGGNRGIGLETCRQLAQGGYNVILGSRDLTKGEQTAESLAKEGLAVTPLKLDITIQAEIDQVLSEIEENYGRLDVLVNNAAILYDDWQRASEANLDTVQQALETNLIGSWRMCQACLPLMLRQRYGRIVNVSSEAGSLTNMGSVEPAYRVSKAGLNALTRMLASELHGWGVLVNAICPSWVATDMGGEGGRPVQEGVAGIIWAATLPDDGPSGGFFRDGKPLPW